MEETIYTVCQNKLCIYYKSDTCILGMIELDMTGMCVSCMYVDIPDNELDVLRKKTLEKLNKRYKH